MPCLREVREKMNKNDGVLAPTSFLRDQVLRVPEARVVPSPGQQVFVRALLSHMTIVKHKDLVCIHNGWKTMGNAYAGPAFCGTPQSIHDSLRKKQP